MNASYSNDKQNKAVVAYRMHHKARQIGLFLMSRFGSQFGIS